MTATAKLGLELLANAAANQTLANTTFAQLNQLVQAGVVDKDLATPPSSPANEALYIVAASPTGAWAGKAGQLAYWLTSTGAWQFIVPREGFIVHVNDEDLFYKYDGSAWASFSAFTGGTLTSALNEAPIVTLASAATVNIGAAAANTISISGTTTITAFDSIASGAVRRLVFEGSLTLTHNATSLVLPDGANIATVAGDSAEFVSLGAGNWRCINYQHRSVGCIVVRSTDLTVPDNTLTEMTFDTEVFDSGGCVDIGTSNLLITAPESGLYMLFAAADLSPATSNPGICNIRLVTPDGTLYLLAAAANVASTANQIASTSLAYLTEGTQLKFSLFQNSGAAKTARAVTYANRFGIVRIA